MSVIDEIAAERRRQTEEEQWSDQHDDDHDTGGLALAAACYAAYSNLSMVDGSDLLPRLWPWEAAWWKPKDPRRNLIRAGALIVAEIERLDRAEKRDEYRKENTVRVTNRNVGRYRQKTNLQRAMEAEAEAQTSPIEREEQTDG